MTPIKQSTARNVMLKVFQSADHISAATGATLTVTLSKDGAAFAAAGASVTERTSGWYQIALTTTDTNTVGDLVIRATASSCDDAERIVQVETDGILSAATIAAAVWAYVVEGSYTALGFLRLSAAAMAGKLSGAATTTVTIRDVSDSKNRVVATVDAYGNRTAITTDVS